MRQLLRLAMVMIAGLGLAVGCSQSSSDKTSASSSPPAPPPVNPPGAVILDSIILNPLSASLEVGQSQVFSATGNYSDGSSAALTVDWASSDNSVVSIAGSNQGSTVTVSGVSVGAITITATSGTVSKMAAVSVFQNVIAADPSPVYGGDGSGDVYLYPALGGGAPTLLNNVGSQMGMAFNNSTTSPKLYFITSGMIREYDVNANVQSDIIAMGGQAIALNFDSQGNLFTMGYQSGDVNKVDVAQGTSTVEGNVSGTKLEFAMDSQDNFYPMPIISSAGGAWVYRNALNNTPMYTWSTAPINAVAANGFLIPAGVLIDRNLDVGYSGTYLDNKIWKHEDINGDGDADDPNEVKVYGTLPIATGSLDYLMSGMCMATGGSILANVMPKSITADIGVYWLKDTNNDGDAADAGEVVKFNDTYMYTGSGTKTLSAPH